MAMHNRAVIAPQRQRLAPTIFHERRWLKRLPAALTAMFWWRLAMPRRGERMPGSGVGRIVAAADPLDGMEAAVFPVWDRNVTFYFISTRRSIVINGATSLLIWDTLQLAASPGRTFDMDIVDVVDGDRPQSAAMARVWRKPAAAVFIRRTSAPIRLARHCQTDLRHTVWPYASGG